VLPPRLLALHGSRARVRHQAWATEAQGGAYADHGKSTARERTRWPHAAAGASGPCL